jgi:hypothetical protein
MGALLRVQVPPQAGAPRHHVALLPCCNKTSFRATVLLRHVVKNTTAVSFTRQGGDEISHRENGQEWRPCQLPVL